MLVYLFGEPGVGKSHLTRRLLKNLTAGEPVHHPKPFHHTEWPNGVIHLGNPQPKNDKHPGTDTLGYSVMPLACDWIKTVPTGTVVLAEGDRLANPKFWNTAQNTGHHVLTIHLHNPHHAALNRQGRQTNQNPTWLKSRQTRVLNLSTHPGTITLNPMAPATPTQLLALIEKERP